MTESIGSTYNSPVPPSSAQSHDIPQLSMLMQSQVLMLADHLRQVLTDPSLSTQMQFLQELSKNGIALNGTVEQANLVR